MAHHHPGEDYPYEDQQGIQGQQSVKHIAYERAECGLLRAQQDASDRVSHVRHQLQYKPAEQNSDQDSNERAYFGSTPKPMSARLTGATRDLSGAEG